MKKVFLQFLTISICTISTLQAQVKVNSLGKLFVGEEPTAFVHDPNNNATVSLWGTGPYREGAKLAFGDLGRHNFSGWNVFVGERSLWNTGTLSYDNSDTDALWLHGKEGIYLTTNGSASNNVAYCTGSAPTDFYFNTNLRALNFFTTSDAKFKSNFVRIPNAMALISKINGFTYDMEMNPYAVKNENEFTKSGVKKTISVAKKIKQYGVTAQNIQTVLPELVKEDSLGLSVNYQGLIPVIIEALKEQQTQIDAQNAKIKRLESLVDKKATQRTEIDEINVSTTIESSTLYQNAPNPFSTETTIKYTLSKSAINSSLWIMNLQGKLVKEYVLEKGSSELILSTTDLTEGMYLYALIVDGVEIDVKKMILNK